MDLGEIHNTILDRRTKGIPGSVEPFPLKAVSYTHLRAHET